MAETTPQVVRNYLAQLDAALAGVAEPVARDIRAGVVEELTGLDAAAAAARIEQLGDPAFIAAEARAEAGPPAAPAARVAPAAPEGDSRAYTIVAALLVALGAFLVPVLGWVVGIAMVWMSRTWTLAEKWIATLAGPVAAGVGAALIFGVRWLATPNAAEAERYAIYAPSVDQLQNPVLPAAFEILWTGVALFLVANLIAGMWLLWRAQRRNSSTQPQGRDSDRAHTVGEQNGRTDG